MNFAVYILRIVPAFLGMEEENDEIPTARHDCFVAGTEKTPWKTVMP